MRRTRGWRGAAESVASCRGTSHALPRVEAALRGRAAFAHRFFIARTAAVPLLLEASRQRDQLRSPRVRRRERRDVLPVRAPFAEMQNALRVARDQHGVEPRANGFAI